MKPIQLLFDLIKPTDAVRMVENTTGDCLFKETANQRSIGYIEHRVQSTNDEISTFNELLFYSVEDNMISNYRIYLRSKNPFFIPLILIKSCSKYMIKKNRIVLSLALISKSKIIIRESFFPPDIFQHNMPSLLRFKYIIKEVVVMTKLFLCSNHLIVESKHAEPN